MKAETIRLDKARVDISATPEAFPLGERGKRPVRFTIYDPEDFATVRSLAIPGVIARGARVDCAWDVAREIAAAVGEPNALDAALQERLTCRLPIPGKDEYDRLGFKDKLYDYQRESVRFLLRRAYAILGELPRAGKCAVILGAFVISGSNRLLILCNALGKYVWGEEVVKWMGEEAVMLFGRSGRDARVYCKHCVRGVVGDDGKPCPHCIVGERFYTVHMLEQVTEPKIWNEVSPEQLAKYQATLAGWEAKCAEKIAKNPAAKLSKKPEPPKGKRRIEHIPVEPPRFRCPVHTSTWDTIERACPDCKNEMMTVLEKARVVICNYDIIYAHKEKDDAGAMYVREDLPGWGPIISRLHFQMAVASESHKLRGWQGKGAGKKDSQNRRERADEVFAEIQRVYGETGTFIYGFTRDGWGQLDVISRGLWS